jgi:hypothetical protein
MSDRALAETRAWVELAVTGLNLCPFAKAPQTKGQVRYALSEARDPEALLQDLVAELKLLAATPPARIETTLLVHPQVLADFADYNDFLDVAEAAVAELGLEGEIQVASFHPRYRFAGADEGDVANATNRSPWPTLHLLREDSVERAVASEGGDAEKIVERNIATLRALGAEGWKALLSKP